MIRARPNRPLLQMVGDAQEWLVMPKRACKDLNENIVLENMQTHPNF